MFHQLMAVRDVDLPIDERDSASIREDHHKVFRTGHSGHWPHGNICGKDSLDDLCRFKGEITSAGSNF